MTPLSSADKYIILTTHLREAKLESVEYYWIKNHLNRIVTPVRRYVVLYEDQQNDIYFVGDEAGNVHPIAGALHRDPAIRPFVLSSALRIIDASSHRSPWMTVRYLDADYYERRPVRSLNDEWSMPIVTRQVELRLWAYNTESHRYHMYAAFDKERLLWVIGGFVIHERAWWEKWGAPTRRKLNRKSFVPLLRSRRNAALAVLDWPRLRRTHGLSSL